MNRCQTKHPCAGIVAASGRRGVFTGAVPAAMAVTMAVFMAVVGGGCRPSQPPLHPVGVRGHWYVVGPNETLGDIARRTGFREQDLLEVNGLRASAEVVPGKTIFVLDPEPKSPPAETPAVVAESGPPAATTREGARFRWPVEDPRVTSLFGRRWGRSHDGIDLTAPIGTTVRAADAGEVVYAGSAVRGYGNMVVLKHAGDLMTVYAHNSVVVVKVGQRVLAGQKVALSGQSGHATGPHVHFEVRSGQVPRDPLPYLPQLPRFHTVRERTPKS